MAALGAILFALCVAGSLIWRIRPLCLRLLKWGAAAGVLTVGGFVGLQLHFEQPVALTDHNSLWAHAGIFFVGFSIGVLIWLGLHRVGYKATGRVYLSNNRWGV